MSNPGVEPSNNNKQDNQTDEAPGVAPAEAGPNKKSWVKRALLGAAAFGIAAAVYQCSSDEPAQAPAPETPAAPAAPQTTEPNAGQQRGSYIYRYLVTKDTELHGPNANDPAIVILAQNSCAESVMGRDGRLSKNGNKLEIMATGADGVQQSRGFIDSGSLLNNGARDSADKRDATCIATFKAVTANVNSTVKNDVEAGQFLTPKDNAALYISHTQTIPASGISAGSCVTTTGNSGNGRTEFSVAANGREYTLWGETQKFEKAPSFVTAATCQAKLQ